jgi:hemerythrin
MDKIEWTESLSVGVRLIDDQHKMWIQHLNDVQAAIEARKGPEQIVSALDFLLDYTHYHFETEEEQMAGSGYAGFEEHKARHDELKATLDDLVRDFQEEGATDGIAEAVNVLLGSWLVKHIAEVDVRLGAFLRERGLPPEGE